MAYPDVDGAADLIDRWISQALDIDPTDSENDEWRNRGLSHLRAVVRKVWEYEGGADWPFVMTLASVNYPAASGVGATDARFVAPARFRRFGDRGSLSILAQRRPMDWRPPQMLRHLRTARPERGPYPRYYTIDGIDTSSGQPYIYTWPFHTNTVDLSAHYETKIPDVTDANPGGLEYIPPEMWENVLLIGMEDWGAMRTGDGRSVQWSQRFLDALAESYSAQRQGMESATGRQTGRGGVGIYGQH